VLKAEFKETRARFGEKTELGRRRTRIGTPPPEIEIPIDATIEREPVTVVLSAKGWIRAAKGHGEQIGQLRYKEGDRERYRVEAQTTDKLILFATNGRFYTLACDKLPGGRGYGDPVRLMLDLGNDVDIVAMLVYRGDRRLLVASSAGYGFVVPEEAVFAQTRAGKQVLNVSGDGEAVVARVVEGDHVAVVGDNRKLVIFPLEEMPEMTRGRGVILQRYKSGGLSDAKTFTLSEGLTWQTGSRTRTETKLENWVGKRSQAGRVAPPGFASNNKFG
jgi:topoisomerase-4 subunit A